MLNQDQFCFEHSIPRFHIAGVLRPLKWVSVQVYFSYFRYSCNETSTRGHLEMLKLSLGHCFMEKYHNLILSNSFGCNCLILYWKKGSLINMTFATFPVSTNLHQKWIKLATMVLHVRKTSRYFWFLVFCGNYNSNLQYKFTLWNQHLIIIFWILN